MVVRLHVGYLHAVGWGEGPCAFMTTVKAIRVGVKRMVLSNRRLCANRDNNPLRKAIHIFCLSIKSNVAFVEWYTDLFSKIQTSKMDFQMLECQMRFSLCLHLIRIFTFRVFDSIRLISFSVNRFGEY